MLTSIENRLEELFEMIEMMPPDKVEAAEKVKKSTSVQLKLLDPLDDMTRFILLIVH